MHLPGFVIAYLWKMVRLSQCYNMYDGKKNVSRRFRKWRRNIFSENLRNLRENIYIINTLSRYNITFR